MSDNQKEQLAWVTRVIQILLLAIATGVGANVYTKVDEIYTEFKVQNQKIIYLTEMVADVRKENERLDRENRTQQQEIESLSRTQNINLQ